jgi:BlaI family penicillinase repressor
LTGAPFSVKIYAMKTERDLSRRERQIMDAVHRAGTATVREITASLPDPPTEDSIRALLRILERKGRLVRRKSEEGMLAYAAAESPRSAGRSALRRVVDTLFGGSPEAAVATLLSDRESRLSPEDLAKIARHIREARKGGNR